MNKPSIGIAAVAASVMIRGFVRGDYKHGRAYCGDCRGKGFDCSSSQTGERSARRCQRCRGKGFTIVGSTKR